RTEGYATASAEAIAQGIPVIASDIAGVRATLGSAALFVRPSDVRALARALERMHDPRVRRRLAAAASRRAASLPRWRDTERAGQSAKSCGSPMSGDQSGQFGSSESFTSSSPPMRP